MGACQTKSEEPTAVEIVDESAIEETGQPVFPPRSRIPCSETLVKQILEAEGVAKTEKIGSTKGASVFRFDAVISKLKKEKAGKKIPDKECEHRVADGKDLINLWSNQEWCVDEGHAHKIGDHLLRMGMLRKLVASNQTEVQVTFTSEDRYAVESAATIRDIDLLVNHMVKTIKYHAPDKKGPTAGLGKYFMGQDAINFIKKEGVAGTPIEAEKACRLLMGAHVFRSADLSPFAPPQKLVFKADGRYQFSRHAPHIKEKIDDVAHSNLMLAASRMHSDLGTAPMSPTANTGPVFFGKIAKDWLLSEGTARSEAEALALLNHMIGAWYIWPTAQQLDTTGTRDLDLKFSESKMYSFIKETIITMEHQAEVNSKAISKVKSENKSGRTPGKIKLGVLRLDYGYPPKPGDIDHPNSFSFPVVYRKVPGLLFEVAQAGTLNDSIVDGFRVAVEELENLGVTGITGDCGFMAHYQETIRGLSSVPVFLSSLCLCPVIVPMCAPMPRDTIIITTANSNSLGQLFPRVWGKPPPKQIDYEKTNAFMEKQFGVRVCDPSQFLVVGFQDLPGFDVVSDGVSLLSAAVDRELVTRGILNLVQHVIAETPGAKVILQECTELPLYTVELRKATGLPVFDSISVCDFASLGYDIGPTAQKKHAVCLGHHCQMSFNDTPLAGPPAS